MQDKGCTQNAKNEHLENQMELVEKEFRTKLDRARGFVSECKDFRDIQQNKDIVNHTNDLSYPQFESELNYNKEFWQVYLKNQIMLKVVKELTDQTTHLRNYVSDIQSLQDKYIRLVRCRSRKKNRRLAVQIEKMHTCPYKQCSRIYGSDVSLNLHIKIKHQGGNKTDREKLAQQICEAEFFGKPVPELTLKFPPGYLNAFRQYYRQNRRTAPQQHSE